MDLVKLNRWKKNFEKGIESLKGEFDEFLKGKDLVDYYILQLDSSDEYYLQISDELPADAKKCLIDLLLETKPEDSI